MKFLIFFYKVGKLIKISNEILAIQLTKYNMSLDEIIKKGRKSESTIDIVAKSLDPQNKENFSRKIFKRIQTVSFRKFWIDVDCGPCEEENSNANADSSDQSPVKLEINLGDVLVEKQCILDEYGRIKTEARAWTQNIYDAIIDTIPCSANIKWKYFIHGKKLFIVLHCRSKNCKLVYKMLCTNLSNDKLRFKITSNGQYLEVLQSNISQRSVSGQRRQKIASEVMQFGAKQVQSQQILESSHLTAINSLNDDVVQRLNSLRKMKSDKLAFADFDVDDSIDLRCLKQTTDLMKPSDSDMTPQFIQYIRSDIFTVAWFCQTQIDYFIASKCKVVSVDATGNLPRSANNTGIRQFYYSIVYRSPITQEILPIFQCISSCHDVASLNNVFQIFSRMLKLTSPNSLKVLTVDFSFALMQTLSQSFNGCDLNIFLLLIYSQIIEKKNQYIKFVMLASCSTHVLKFFTDKLKKFDKNSKKILTLNFAKAIMAKTYAEFIEIFSDIYIALKYDAIPFEVMKRLSTAGGI